MTKSKLELALEVVDDDIREFEILDDLSNTEKARVFQVLARKFAKRIAGSMNDREKLFTITMVLEDVIRGLFPDAKWLKELEFERGHIRIKYMTPDYEEKEVRW